MLPLPIGGCASLTAVLPRYVPDWDTARKRVATTLRADGTFVDIGACRKRQAARILRLAPDLRRYRAAAHVDVTL
jgi:hypothetical protein